MEMLFEVSFILEWEIFIYFLTGCYIIEFFIIINFFKDIVYQTMTRRPGRVHLHCENGDAKGHAFSIRPTYRDRPWPQLQVAQTPFLF